MSDEKAPPSSSSGTAMKATVGRLAELMGELRELLAQEMDAVQQRWQRTLPFADYVVDRWQKAKALGFGEGSSIYDSALVLGDVKVGKNTWIGPFTVLDGSGGLEIGDNCSISAGVQIYTHDTVKWATSGGTEQPERAPVRIGHNCYIGPHAIISKGITIGVGCVIGANSMVNSDIPDGMKAWGTPARCQGKVTEMTKS
jgi:acetyltransferase-like isoleucine patch superfamily enzyme